MSILCTICFTEVAFSQCAFKDLCFYVCAHQDDWQLFMGTNVYKDINRFNEKGPFPNGKKVVIIYTTAGNLNDIDDAKVCDCRDPHDNSGNFPYWKVREAGALNSIHLAAARLGGWGANFPYQKYKTCIINGHEISRYEYKNTVSYFLRTKTGMFDKWAIDPYAPVSTVDNSTTYINRADFVNTLFYLYKSEMDTNYISPTFNMPDINKTINPGDHSEHFETGEMAFDAIKLLSAQTKHCYPVSLFIDYHSQDMPENLSKPHVQNEAGLVAVYCMALLDHNAWPEWGKNYQEWTSRNYYRTITSCQEPADNTTPTEGSGAAMAPAVIYPNPAKNVLNVQLTSPPAPHIQVKLVNMAGNTVYYDEVTLTIENTFKINTATLLSGTYILTVEADGQNLSNNTIEVVH